MTVEKDYPESEVRYVEKRAHEGVSSKVIATELRYEFDNTRGDDSDELLEAYVDAIREQYGFPGQNIRQIYEGMTGKPVGGEESSTHASQQEKQDLGLSQEFEKSGSEKEPEIPTPISGNVKNPRKIPLREIKKRVDRRPIESSFVPNMVTKFDAFKKESIYVHPSAGPMLCKGSETIDILGIQTFVVSFVQMNKEKSPLAIQIPRGAFEADISRYLNMNNQGKALKKRDYKNHAMWPQAIKRDDRPEKRVLRHLATKDQIDNVLERLEGGQSNLRGVPKFGASHAGFFDDAIVTHDLDQLVDVILYVGASKELSYSLLKTRDRALDMVASECAIVTKKEYAYVRSQIMQMIELAGPTDAKHAFASLTP